MRPQILNPGKRVSEKAIVAIEKRYGFRFPDGYRAFLLEVNGGEPRPGAFRRKGSKRYSEVCSDFLGVANGRDYADLENALECYKGKDEPRIPDRLVPIANDPFGNLICISTSGKDVGQIFFWHHEDELGQKLQKGKGVDDSAIWVIADSFEEFLEQFEPVSAKGQARWEKIVLSKDLDGFKKWLDEGGDFRAQNKEMESPLWMAVKIGSRELIDEVLRRGARVDEVLEAIINEANWKLAKWLLAKPEAKGFEVKGWHFGMALGSGDVDVVRMFLDAGASVEMDLRGSKPIHRAAAHAEMVKLLLERGARAGEPDSTGRVALTTAIFQRNLEAAKMLMDAGDDLYLEPANGISKVDREMLAHLEEMEKKGTGTASFINGHRKRIEGNRTKAPFFYLQQQKDQALKKAIVAHAKKLGQRER